MNSSARVRACRHWEALLSAYLDGEGDREEIQAVEKHLDVCVECTAKVAAYRQIGREMRLMAVPAPPSQLELRLRVAASHASVPGQRLSYAQMRLTMMMQALALPLTVGMCAALLLFGVLVGGVRPLGPNNPKLPEVLVSYASPPRLANAPSLDLGVAMLVEANIDANGRVYGYRVISGPTDEASISRLNYQLLMSVFTPATTNSGEPTTGSVVMAFGTNQVRG